MEDGNMDAWKKFLNRGVIAIYDDGGQFPKKKQGALVSVSPTHLFLKIDDSRIEALLTSRIMRLEVQDD